MSKYQKVFIVIFIVFNFFLSSWYVLHKDIFFFTDVARDFLIYEEIDEKKIIFIGPRSSTSGIFHGPLWPYLNYPAYLLGQGNPLVVGWYWIFLTVVSVVSSFYIAKKLFDENTAYLFALILSLFLVFHTKSFFNPYGALFFMPAFFYCFVRYIETLKGKYLVFLILTGGILVQFQMAIGIPMLFLALLYTTYLIIRKRKFFHFLFYSLILIPLSTFILFDIRHQFLMFNSFLKYIGPGNRDPYYKTYLDLVLERIGFIWGAGLQIFRQDVERFHTLLLFVVMSVLIYFQVKDNKYKASYLSFIYFYAGFFILSIINKSGGLLLHYFLPLAPLTLLIFSSFITSRFKKMFAVLFVIVYLINIHSFRFYVEEANVFIGKHEDSWKFLKSMTDRIYEDEEEEFGYFVYSPDSYGYQTKYAMHYAEKTHPQNEKRNQKDRITYLVLAPDPKDNPFINSPWWIENKFHITKKPIKEIKFENGFKIQKYKFSDEEINIAPEKDIDPGIHFR